MSDQPTETPDHRRGVGPWLWYPCLLISIVLVVAPAGAVFSPVILGLIIAALSAYGGFLLALFIAILLGISDSDVPPPSPHEKRTVLGLGVLSVIVCTVVFGPEWLLGFAIYDAVVIGMFWQIKRRKATERADQ